MAAHEVVVSKCRDVLPSFERGWVEFSPMPKFTYDRTLSDEIASGRLSRVGAEALLKVMLLIRAFEETIVRLKEGRFAPKDGFKFVGATHLCIGQEAVAAGAIAASRRTDYITSTHRGHGHSIAKGFFALCAMTDDELRDFVSGYSGCVHDARRLQEAALQVHLYRTFAEIFGKEDGYCRGRGGGMHIADFDVGHLGANAIVGGSSAVAAGAAISLQKQGKDSIVLCFIGDGAVNNGVCMEAMNMACMAQFERGTPLVFVVENNQYGMTGKAIGEVTGLDYLARRAAGFSLVNMHAEVVNGMNVLAVYDGVSRAAELARQGSGPVLLECLTYRYLGHSLSDDGTKYRSDEERAAWRSLDPIAAFKREVELAGVLDAAGIAELEENAYRLVTDAAMKAAHAADPDPATISEGLFSATNTEAIGREYGTIHYNAQRVRRLPRTKAGELLYRHAILEAITEEMLRDRRVVVFGEDVAAYGGAFQATYGLLDIFGRDRVFNTAISESAIVGAALGMALTGLRPVAEIMYIDFILQAMDQLGNQVCKTRYMFGGKPTVPLVIRTTIGGGRGYAGQHSQSLEAVVAHFPGIKIAAPATSYDAKGLLKAAIRDDNPVLFIEHQLLYPEKDVVPNEDYTVPFGKAVVRREGRDATIIAYSYMVKVALEAALLLEAQGVSTEVLDLRTLYPLDEERVIASAARTGRVIALTQAPVTGSFAEHIAQCVHQGAFGSLRAPVRIVGAHAVPPPMAQSLERENMPGPEKVVAAVHDMLKLGG